MSDVLITPLMNLPNPIPGADPGPDYATNLYNSLNIIDQHNHAVGSGNQINTSAILINADLPFNSNYNATQVRSVRFTAQGAPIAGATDLGCLYVSGADLYYNDENGNQVRITSGGSVNATSSGISSGTATASFSGGVLIVNQNTNTPGNIQAGSLLIGNNVTSSNFITLAPTAALAASYTFTLPSAPPATSGAGLAMDTSGNVTTSIGGLVPSGVILPFGGTAAPAGYLLCDGTSYLRSAYPNLYVAIGNAYGTADGTHFNVPDLRGRFLRGTDNMGTGAAGVDPDASTRTALNAGGNTANNVGSAQGHAFQSHTHGAPVALAALTPGGSSTAYVTGSITNLPVQTTGASGTYSQATASETRPVNVYANHIIKI